MYLINSLGLNNATWKLEGKEEKRVKIWYSKSNYLYGKDDIWTLSARLN